MCLDNIPARGVELIMKKQFLTTPIRRLDGITYWVIEDPDGIYDFINTEIRKEWEADARSEGRDPRKDKWLRTLSQSKWSLEILETERIKLNPNIMNYVNTETGYNFAERLAKRSKELQDEIETYSLVIWPVIVRKEKWVLADGYCRYTALRALNVRKIYAYVGTLEQKSTKTLKKSSSSSSVERPERKELPLPTHQ